MSDKHKIITALLVIAVFAIGTMVLSYFQNGMISPSTRDELGKCDRLQRQVNIKIIPNCYAEVFKEAGWSKERFGWYIEKKQQNSDTGLWKEALSRHWEN